LNLATHALQRRGRGDVLGRSVAGTSSLGSFEQITVDRLQEEIALNVSDFVRLSRWAMSVM